MNSLKKLCLAAVACFALGMFTVGCSQNTQCCGTGDSCCKDTKAAKCSHCPPGECKCDHSHKHQHGKAMACKCPSGACKCDHAAGKICSPDCTAKCCAAKNSRKCLPNCMKPCCKSA